MLTQQNNVFLTSYLLFIILSLSMSALPTYSPERLAAGTGVASITYEAFINMFISCVHTKLPSQQFKIDNIKGFINYPSRTTVGSSPKVTSNRKFFANVVSTRVFKEMLEKDLEEIKTNYIKKMKYCNTVVMNQEVIKDFYDREVDQTKM